MDKYLPEGWTQDKIDKALEAKNNKPIMEKLKPCPFCGGEAEEFNLPSLFGGYNIQCKECSAEINNAQQWNRRATRPEPEKPIEFIAPPIGSFVPPEPEGECGDDDCTNPAEIQLCKGCYDRHLGLFK